MTAAVLILRGAGCKQEQATSRMSGEGEPSGADDLGCFLSEEQGTLGSEQGLKPTWCSIPQMPSGAANPGESRASKFTL